MKSLFRPAISFMNKLPFPYKFACVGLIVFSIFAFLFYSFVSESLDKINFSAKERTGVDYNMPVKNLIVNLTTHRDLVNRFLLYDKSIKDKILAVQQSIDDDLKKIDIVEAKYATTLKTTELLQKIKNQWSEIKTKSLNLELSKAISAHNGIISDALSLIAHVGDTSNLILDPDLDSFYLMDAIITKLLPLVDILGQIQVEGIPVSYTHL
ncbi:MAG: hypothetical protein N2738_07310, partial [Thermodesulfovibrionales bacterium]|nr:hypothetical protein [Thermodesulfovibrionales bacterium]